jgi:hypothetical protein
MKSLLTIFALMIAGSVFGDVAGTNVMVRLGQISVIGTHTNLWFDCDVTINNQTDVPLTVTNLFAKSPGLALKITDLNGKELKRTYAWPLKAGEWTHAPGSEKDFKRLGYGAKPGKNGKVLGISLPETMKTVRLQIEGTLSGSSYSGAVTSNIVEVKVPR